MRLLAMALILGLVTLQDDPAKAVRELIEKFRSGDLVVREEATQKLKDLGKAAKVELEKAAKDGDGEVSRLATTLVERLTLQETLSPRLQEHLPGLADKLAFGGDPAWTQAFLAVALKCGESSRLPILTRKEIEPLASRAARGAESEADKAAVAQAVNTRRLRLPVADLLLLLEDPRHGIRPSIVESVNRAPPDELVRRLIEVTRDEEAFRRGRAIEDLGELGIQSAIPDAERLLRDADTLVRERAIGALSDLRAKGSAAAILPLLKDHEPRVRSNALECLDNLYARDAIPRIEELLQDEVIFIREEALKTLGGIDARESISKMIPLLKDPDEDVRRAAAYALRDLHAREAIPEVKKLLADPENWVRMAAFSFFDEVDPKQAVALYVEQMKDPESISRWRAAEYLGDLGGPEAVAGLVETLKDSDLSVASAAAIALSKLGDRRGLEILVRAFKKPPYDDDKVMCALAELGVKEIIPKVVARFKDKSDETRRSAVWALYILGAKEEAAKLEPLLKDPDILVRWQVPYVLAKLQEREAIPRLLPLLQDQAAGVVHSVIQALALIKAWDMELEVAKMLEDLEPSVRYHAASWLARAGSTKGVPELLDQDELPRSALNALKEPEIWKRLDGMTAPADLRGTRLQKIEKVAQVAEMKVVVEPAPLGDSQRTYGREHRDNLFGPKDSVVAALWTLVPQDQEMILEKDRIRLMDRATGERFWREWWKDYQASRK